MIEGKDWIFWGHYVFKAKISSNQLVMRNEGPNKVKFAPDGQTITYQYPFSKVGGMLWGDRTLNMDGTMVFEDPGNCLKAVVLLK